MAIPYAKPAHTLGLSDHTRVELVVNDQGDFLGLGCVWTRNVLLRARTVPLRPVIRSSKGVVYTRFRLKTIVPASGGGHDIHTVVHGTPLLEGDYGDEYDQRLVWPTADQAPVVDELVWKLRPHSLKLHDNLYEGFTYAFEFISRHHSVARIMVVSTWEPGGNATGNTILSAGQVTPPVYHSSHTTHFTTACLKRLYRFGDPQGMSFQFSPRYAPHPGIDFLVSAAGTLLGYWPARADVRSLVQKNPGEELIFVLDQSVFPLAPHAKVEPKAVLFYCAAPAGTPGTGMPDHEARNRWNDALEHSDSIVRDAFGIKPSIPKPGAHVGYKMRRSSQGRLENCVGDQWVPSEKWLATLADVYLPAAAARGLKRIMAEIVVQTDATERGDIRKLDHFAHGDLIVGSVCCVHRYKPADLWGGMEGWKYLAKKAHALGLEIGHWVGPHLAYHAPIFKEHPDWMLVGRYTKPFSGGYPNRALAALNWNTQVGDWILEDLIRMKEAGGLDFLFIDSLGNLGLLANDFSRDQQTNTSGLARFFAKAQERGIHSIHTEATGPLGVGVYGINDPYHALDPDPMRLKQNSWDWFAGNEDMLIGQAPHANLHPQRTDEEIRLMLFRSVANHCAPTFPRHSDPFYPAPPWVKRCYDLLIQAQPDMVRRTLLPNRQGVLWTSSRATLLFAFESINHPLVPGARVHELDGDKATPVPHHGTLHAAPWSAYRMTM